MKTKKPKFSNVNQLEEHALHGRLLATRELISHPAVKGLSLEADVATTLREILPTEYGIGTGFIAHHGTNGPELTRQLDIIIYDAIRSGPLSRLSSTAEIYPIEGVYAYVEVKASISVPNTSSTRRSNSLQHCLEQNRQLRKIRQRLYFDVGEFGIPDAPQLVNHAEWPAIRGYVFAFGADDETAKNPDRLAEACMEHSKKSPEETHLHGLLVLDQVFLRTRKVNVDTAKQEDYCHINFVTDHTLSAFKLQLLHDLDTFPRPLSHWVPAREKYFELPVTWKWARP